MLHISVDTTASQYFRRQQFHSGMIVVSFRRAALCEVLGLFLLTLAYLAEMDYATQLRVSSLEMGQSHMGEHMKMDIYMHTFESDLTVTVGIQVI